MEGGVMVRVPEVKASAGDMGLISRFDVDCRESNGCVDRRTKNPATGSQSGSDPVAATKEECALHTQHCTPGIVVRVPGFEVRVRRPR